MPRGTVLETAVRTAMEFTKLPERKDELIAQVKGGEMFGLNVRKVFPSVMKYWAGLPGDLTDTYPSTSLGTSSTVSRNLERGF